MRSCQLIIFFFMTQQQMTPLHWACFSGQKEVVSVLLANNANLEALTKVSIFIFLKG